MKIAFRLDCGSAIGSGHLIRCGALAEELDAQGWEVLFICRNKVPENFVFPVLYLPQPYTYDGANQYSFPSLSDEVDELVRVLKRECISCLIVDHYGADAAYFGQLRPYVRFLAAIDDLVQETPNVDAIINGNIYADSQAYKRVPLRLCGPDYTLLRRCFRDQGPKEIQEQIREIYITSGGADPLSISKKLLYACQEQNWGNCMFHVVVGPSFQRGYIEELAGMAQKDSRVELLYGADMALLMRKADLFVTASGSTLYELAASGVPNISVVLAEDQRKLANEMHRLGTTYNIGEIERIKDGTFSKAVAVLDSAEVRRRMGALGQSLIDGYGTYRAACQISKWIKEKCYG